MDKITKSNRIKNTCRNCGYIWLSSAGCKLKNHKWKYSAQYRKCPSCFRIMKRAVSRKRSA